MHTVATRSEFLDPRPPRPQILTFDGLSDSDLHEAALPALNLRRFSPALESCLSEFEFWSAWNFNAAIPRSPVSAWGLLEDRELPYTCGNPNPGFLLDESPAFFEAPQTPSSPQSGAEPSWWEGLLA